MMSMFAFLCIDPVEDDKDDILQLIQKANAATYPIIVTRSGKYIFGHEAQSCKGEDLLCGTGLGKAKG
jgi:hypothetical protein